MYRDLNDYEILYLVKENDDIDYAILYEKYKPLVYKIALKYKTIFKTFGYELDDLMQIGYMSLFNAIKHFESDISLFYTYSLNVIEYGIINEIRKNNTNKRKVLNDSISYDVLVPNSNLSYIEIIPDTKENIYDINDNYEELIVFKNTLPFMVSCIFELKYEGFSDEEISLLLDISLKEVRKGIKLIKSQSLYR